MGQDERPRAFFDAALHRYHQAEQSSGIVQRDYCVAGRTFRLCFAGPEMVSDFTRAFAHLESDPVENPGLTIFLYDAVSTGVPLPDLPWAPSDYEPHGAVRGFNTERFHTTVFLDFGILSVMDGEQGLAVYAMRDPEDLYILFMASPLFQILHWWLLREGLHILHGAAVGTPDGAALLVGPSGSGKSTSAMACLASDLRYVSDDYCLLVMHEDSVEVHSLYNTAKLTHENIHRFPSMEPAAINDRKAIYFLRESLPAKLEPWLPLRAIVVPKVLGLEASRTQPIGPGPVFQALAPSTMMQLQGSGAHSFKMLAELSRTVPGYALELGPNLEQIPSVIRNLLNGLSS